MAAERVLERVQHGVAPCRKIDSARMRQFAENTTLTFTDLAVEFASSMGTQADSPSGVVVGVHLDSFVVRQPTASQRARAACGVSARGAACGGPTWQRDLAGSMHHVCETSRAVPLRQFDPRPCTQAGPSTSSNATQKTKALQACVLSFLLGSGTLARLHGHYLQLGGFSVFMNPAADPSNPAFSLPAASVTGSCEYIVLPSSASASLSWLPADAAHAENIADKHGRIVLESVECRLQPLQLTTLWLLSNYVVLGVLRAVVSRASACCSSGSVGTSRQASSIGADL